MAEEKKEAKLTATAEKVLEMVEKMTILELNDLVKAMEEKFGITANAPIAVAEPAVSTEVATPAEEKTEFDVVLTATGEKKIDVIKAVRELNQTLGLIEAKNLVESAPKVILEKAKKEAAEEAKKKLEAAGAKVELK
ncbi:50S ribosomal protein L7/L12 [Candidatus Parcubacteria bacterium]|nr:50S ribosomal protein L7/L12 [Patescibacteria group bacterium]MBU4380977.1 50S ribosomal protein L7/L12 [Patescibacteria group bacterium]MCG2689390.1 50S ribosomal protein L7/L12 [Candidatus Parcubacteria bacterium]